MPPTRPRLLVFVLLVLTPMPLVVHVLTVRQCRDGMARMLERRMESGEWAVPEGYRSHEPAAASRLMVHDALDTVIPTGDMFTAFGTSGLLLACTIGAFRMRTKA